MANEWISEGLARFIRQNIASIGQLEVLLLLFEKPAKSWSAGEIGQKLRTSTDASILHLKRLANNRLVQLEAGPGPETYTFDMRSPQNIEYVKELSKL